MSGLDVSAEKNRQAVHGGLLLALLALPLLWPPLRHWPWYLLVPVSVWALAVSAVAPLRRSVRWLRRGNLDWRVLAATSGLILVASVALVVYDVLFRPDLQYLIDQLPARPASWLLVGATFAVVNAVLEEAIFRGVLLDAFAGQGSLRLGLVLQAAVFGICHAHGYPPGALGAVLAGLYGLALGLLRLYSGGMLAAVLAHVCADTTIFAIVLARME